MAYIPKVSREKPLGELIEIFPIYPAASSSEKLWCWLIKIGENYVMCGPTGTHSISAETALDLDGNGDTRLDVHWHGFKENNVAKFHGESY